MSEDDDGRATVEAMEAYVAPLLPVQQQAIATAQLVGCRFERIVTMRLAGFWEGYRGPRWINTTSYEAFLPDGVSVGTFEDIYEGALACLAVLNAPAVPPLVPPLVPARALFKLDPENEQERGDTPARPPLRRGPPKRLMI